MLYVALSLVALLLGPLSVTTFRTRRSLLAAVDGFVVVSIAGIVLLHVLPHALLEVGAWAFVPAILGFALPLLGERAKAHTSRISRDRWLVPLAAIGMIAHALLDGTVLNPTVAEHTAMLPIAVVLHRIPEGLAIWWLFRPLVGARFSLGALGLVGAATVAGFHLSIQFGEIVPEKWLVLLQALVAGCLLHVVAHHELEHEGDEGGHAHIGHVASGLGSVVGVGLILASLLTHPVSRRIEMELGLVSTLRTLALASAPPLVFALVASAVLRSFATERVASSLKRGPGWLEAARGVIVGAFFPVCSCDVFVLYRRLRASGAPNRSAISLLVSAPEMELAAFTLSMALLGPGFALVRIGSVAACGVVAGLIVGRTLPSNGMTTPPKDESLSPTPTRLRRAVGFALGETVEHTGPWLILGLVVAALLEPFVGSRSLAGVPVPFQIAACALLGIVGYLCPSGITPVVAILVHKGLAPGAAISFLLMSAAANARVLKPLAQLHGKSHALLYAATLLGSSFVVGGAAQHLLGREVDVRLHAAATESASVGAVTCLGILAISVLAALLRRGPRYLLGQILPTHDHA